MFAPYSNNYKMSAFLGIVTHFATIYYSIPQVDNSPSSFCGVPVFYNGRVVLAIQPFADFPAEIATKDRESDGGNPHQEAYQEGEMVLEYIIEWVAKEAAEDGDGEA